MARILVVADDPNLQRVLSHTLRREGHDIVLAPDGAEGLRRARVDSPALIVLDARVPQVDGHEVVRRIRASEGTAAHVPVIMLGPESDVDVRVRGLRAGADDFQTTPVHPAELVARVRGLLARFAPRERANAGPRMGQVHAYYGAKGGVGTTTLAINAAITLQREMKRKVALVDANLQFGDHRVFLDLGADRHSILDAVGAPTIDQMLLSSVLVRHDSDVDLLLAPPTPESAELVSAERHHLGQIVEQLRDMHDYVVVDLDKRLDDHTLDVITLADVVFVVMTADLSCLKNVRLVLETMGQLGVPDDKVQLVLNRSNAFTGIGVKSAESVLRRSIEYQVVNDYRTAISALNSGSPFMHTRTDSLLGRSVLEFVRGIDKTARRTTAPVPQFSTLPALAAG